VFGCGGHGQEGGWAHIRVWSWLALVGGLKFLVRVPVCVQALKFLVRVPVCVQALKFLVRVPVCVQVLKFLVPADCTLTAPAKESEASRQPSASARHPRRNHGDGEVRNTQQLWQTVVSNGVAALSCSPCREFTV